MTPSWNTGQQYEDDIRCILRDRNLLPDDLGQNDAGFIAKDGTYYIEIKNRNAPDFGQRRILWDTDGGWHWAKQDDISALFDTLGVLERIDKTLIPRRYSMDKDQITIADRRFNQQRFEESNIVIDDLDLLRNYYTNKGCDYIQIEDKGFYYFVNDPADLGVPQFNPNLRLRLRAKTHHSNPPSAYSFFAVIQIVKRTLNRSPFDLEEITGPFPKIKC